jgi:hypothetical protein
MYLGKPQTKHPMYDISEASTKNKTIYTIKEKFMDKPHIEEQIGKMLDEIYALKIGDANIRIRNKIKPINKGESYLVGDTDKNYFGTMGGFH